MFRSGLQPKAGNGAFPLGDSNNIVVVASESSSRRLLLADILLSCVGCFASFTDLAQLLHPFRNAPVPVFTAGDILSPLLKSDVWPATTKLLSPQEDNETMRSRRSAAQKHGIQGVGCVEVKSVGGPVMRRRRTKAFRKTTMFIV
jgi:hypothetical protein